MRNYLQVIFTVRAFSCNTTEPDASLQVANLVKSRCYISSRAGSEILLKMAMGFNKHGNFCYSLGICYLVIVVCILGIDVLDILVSSCW